MITKFPIDVLKKKIENKFLEVEDYLGFYHENDMETVELLFLEDQGCKIYGKSLEEIRELGPAFLAEIMHPEDIPYCIDKLQTFAKKENENDFLSYFQRLKLVGEDEYKTYITTVKLNLEQKIFQCVTTPMTEIDEFQNEVNTLLNASKFIDENIQTFSSLSAREKEVMKLVCQGKSAKEIAEELFLSVHTIEKHKKNIYKKCDFRNKTDLIFFALAFNII